MLQMMLSQEVMAKTAQRIMKLLPYKDNSDMIKRAWHLYRTGHVYNVTIENNVLKGKVTDRGHTYEPTFRLKQAASSSCACTAVGLCPHNIALFLYAYNQIDAVGNLIRQWKEPTTKQKHVRRDEKQKHIQVTEQHKKDAAPNGNIIDAWWNSFEKAYRRIPLDYITEEEQMRRIVHSFFQTFERPTAKKPFLDHLYYVHASLFTFMELTRIPLQPWGYSAMMQERHVNQFAQTVQQAMKDLAKKPRSNMHEQLLYDSIPYVRNILLGKIDYVDDILAVYEEMWNTLFTKATYREEECTWAIEQLNKSETLERKIPFIGAASYISFLLGNDERAYKLIHPFPYLAIEHMVDFMHISFAQKNIQRGVEWFERLEQNANAYLYTLHQGDREWFVRTLLSAYHRYSGATGDEQHGRYEQLLQTLLPYSFYEYIDYLFDEQQWKKLIELYMFEQATVDIIPPFHLKAIEQADRSLVLPLYHQTIMKYIEQKNRTAYEQAVKHLRKLRAHYRALKQTHRWEAYVEKLAEQTKRLRAFQQLLQRGKLI